MEYLTRKKQTDKSRMHVWTGVDTGCRMASTGGLRLSKYKIVQGTSGRPICKNCLNVLENSETRITAVKPEFIGRIPKESPLIDDDAEMDLVLTAEDRL